MVIESVAIGEDWREHAENDRERNRRPTERVQIYGEMWDDNHRKPDAGSYLLFKNAEGKGRRR